MDPIPSLIFSLMCITYIYWCIRFGVKGYRYARGKAQYKPWLQADDSLNWKFGLTLLIASTIFCLMSAIFLVDILVKLLWSSDGILFELYCLGFPILLICGIYLYIFNQEINQMEQKES